MDIESYIKDLSPELQEKVRACGSVEELLALAKEAKVPLPDEALAAIAGGDDPEAGGCKDPIKCGGQGAAARRGSGGHRRRRPARSRKLWRGEVPPVRQQGYDLL